MSNFKILDGKIRPLKGTYDDNTHIFTFTEPLNTSKIKEAILNIDMFKYIEDNTQTMVNNGNAKPNNLSLYISNVTFNYLYTTTPSGQYQIKYELGDNLNLYITLARNGNWTASFGLVGYFGLDDNDYINTQVFGRIGYSGTEYYSNISLTTPFDQYVEHSDNTYYNLTGLHNDTNSNSCMSLLFLYDENTSKIIIPNNYNNLPFNNLNNYDNMLPIHNTTEYLTTSIFESYSNDNNIAINRSNIDNSYYFDVSNYVNYREYIEYPGGGSSDDGNGSNPGQTQNDENSGQDGNYDNSTDTTDSADYYDNDYDSPFEPPIHDSNWNTGIPLYTLFKMSFSRLSQLLSYLTSSTWSSAITNLGLGSVFGAIQKCITVPFDVTARLTDLSIHILGINTNVPCDGVVNHLQTVDCGTITIDRYFGDFKDYAPYTKCYLYLPYIGVNEISLNQVQGKSLSLIYGVDLLDGSCVARLSADDKQLYSFSGNCATEYPIVGKSVSSPLAAATNLLGNITGSDTLAATAGLLGSVLTSQNSSSTFQTVGGVAGNWGNVGVLTPFVYLERPVQSRANSFESLFGYTCNKYLPLNVLSGYTEVDESLHLSTTATTEEKELLKEILTSGFYINDSE